MLMPDLSKDAPLLPAQERRCFQGKALASVLLAVFVCLVMAVPPAFAELKLPTFQGRITDEAGLLKPEDRDAIEEQLKKLEETSTDQVAVVTVNSLQGRTIEDMGLALGRQWGIGQKTKDNGVVRSDILSEDRA